ncbi:hypothetical protein [Acaryochloris marina]|uniref:hypothetical protein n=1 Tax=Acaryochloris marina TaxID=155978 RepID=UPI0021C2F244|nr:hypothetical protein [Acaryochloris marina]BDM77688.1 hypothetical protein AM10699_05620 [Acaryochloris marina MBIC10699]
MLALYMLGAGLILSGLFMGLTWFGGRVVRQQGPMLGFVGAALMMVLALLPFGYLTTYFWRAFQANGWAERAYQLCFTAAVAVPMFTGVCCALLLLWASLVAQRRQRRRRQRRVRPRS